MHITHTSHHNLEQRRKNLEDSCFSISKLTTITATNTARRWPNGNHADQRNQTQSLESNSDIDGQL